jgi:WD40 repeat protein
MDSTTIKSVTSPEETQDNFNTDSNFDKEECFTLRYDETNKFLAAGYSTGFIGIFNLEKPETSIDYKKSYSISTFPITCLRWKPFNRTTLIAVTAEGFIIQLHSKSGKILQKLEEEKNPLMCVDYSPDGSLFATGGNDKVVRLYDDNTKTLITKLERHRFDLPEHSNRIFAVKFSKKDPNLLMSAGWDNTILLYDIRTKQVQNYLYGPHVCGDGLDLKDDLLLTVSWAKEDQIQLFDLRSNKKLGVFQMVLDENKENSLENISYLYSCRFNPVNTTFCVTGSNKNYLRLYDYSNLNSGDFTQSKIKGILDLKDINEPCYCCDYNLKGNRLAYGCAKSKINFLDLK